MIPSTFPEANTCFGPPPDLHPNQCMPIHGCRGEIGDGCLDGSPVVVVAWKPNPEEIRQIVDGANVYLTFLGENLPPHRLTTSFGIVRH